jgi:branched-chain amino acid transport system substrate-binding protein
MNNMHLITFTVTALFAIATQPSYAQQAAGTIKIGVVTSLSGTLAAVGRPIRWGLELATKEVNAAGGILGRQVSLLVEDEEGNPSVAVQKTERLIQLEKVDFITGTVNSGSTLAVGQVGERNDKLVSTTVSYADSITAEKCSPNVFRVNIRAEQQSIALGEWLAKTKPKARIFYIGPDYEMGRSSVAAFRSVVEKKGLTSVGEFFAPLDSKDYTQYFGKIRAARPDVIYTSVVGNDTVRLLSQMAEFGLLEGVTLIGSAGVITSQNIVAVGKAGEGFVNGTGYSPKIDTAENKKFVDAFRVAYKADPDSFAADAYGMIYAYKAAVEKAKSTDTDKVRTALRGLSWQTPQGTKTIRAGDHQVMQDVFVVSIRGGQFQVTGKIDAASAIGPDTCTRF